MDGTRGPDLARGLDFADPCLSMMPCKFSDDTSNGSGVIEFTDIKTNKQTKWQTDTTENNTPLPRYTAWVVNGVNLYKLLNTISNLLIKSWRFDVIWRLLQNWEWVDSSPRSLISVDKCMNRDTGSYFLSTTYDKILLGLASISI